MKRWCGSGRREGSHARQGVVEVVSQVLCSGEAGKSNMERDFSPQNCFSDSLLVRTSFTSGQGELQAVVRRDP